MCTRGEGRVPDEGEGVVEDVGGVWSGLTRVHNVSPILLSELHLHELQTSVRGREIWVYPYFWNVESEWDEGHGHDVDEESLCVGHRLRDGPEVWTGQTLAEN